MGTGHAIANEHFKFATGGDNAAFIVPTPGSPGAMHLEVTTPYKMHPFVEEFHTKGILG